MVKNITIFDIHSYKEFKNKSLSDLTIEEQLRAFSYYRQPMFAKLQFIKRNQFFRIIEKYLAKERNIYQFFTYCSGFFSDIARLIPPLYSELDQLADFKLLDIGILELKIEANPPELVLLDDFVEKLYYNVEERTECDDPMVINEAEEQEFYDSLKKLFKEVQKLEDLSN